jgi:RND superfamily putative drug exporter
MVGIFQRGHLPNLLNFASTGLIDTATPITMFCIAFGPSMDYEVFLLSRNKEEYDRTGDNTASVALGLERTGRLVTAAAAVLAVLSIAFATSEITFIKLLGVMRLAGKANGWAPAPLRRIQQRWGISDGEPPAPSAVLPDEDRVRV